jgi:hypothetical protein
MIFAAIVIGIAPGAVWPYAGAVMRPLRALPSLTCKPEAVVAPDGLSMLAVPYPRCDAM